MGNVVRSSPATKKFDFVFALPPELVAVILSSLSLSEVLNCMLVCKKWRDGILHQHTYWSGLLQSIGMSPRSVSDSVKLFASHRDCYFAVRRHQQGARTMELVSSMATCYPKISAASSFFMERLNTVAITERVEGDNYLRVVEILSGGVVTTRELRRVRLSSDLSAARWMHYSRGSGCVYWTDNSGCCWGCNLLSQEQPVEFRGDVSLTCCDAVASGVTGGSTSNKSMVSPSLAGPNIKANLARDRERLLAGCDKCSMLLACWSECDSAGSGVTKLTFLVSSFGGMEALAPAVTLLQRIQHLPTCHFGEPLKLKLHSSAHATSQQTTCPSHYALVQGKEATTITFLTGLGGPPSMEMKCECLRCSHHLPCMGLTVISPCGVLIGCFACDGRLHVWQVEIETSTLRLFSNTSKVLAGCSGRKRPELVALGHHLSIARQGSVADTGGDTIHIIHTESGNVLKSVHLSDPPSIPPHPQPPLSSSSHPPGVYLLSREAQQWLCDLSCPSPRTLLTVVSTAGGDGTVRFLLLRQPPSTTGHYVQAINYVFQE